MGRPLIVAAMLACSSIALASEPVRSVDSFESDIRKCLLQSSNPAGCLADGFRGHFIPGKDNEKLNEVVTQVAGLFRQWLGKDKVYALHPVKQKTVGDFYEERVYLIEDAAGNIIMLETGFVNKLGEWYVHRFNLSSKKETMQAVLGIDL